MITETEKRGPRCWVVLDLESAVLDHAGHRRYQQMERWVPSDNGRPSRPHYTRGEDPLQTPRWVFQTIVTASILVAREHAEGGLDVTRFVTYSAPEQDETAVLVGVLKELADAGADAELVSWGGAMHDVPLLIAGCARHGLTLPAGWKWMSFGGANTARHLDLMRVFTGGFKMKPIHQTELLAAMDLPGKIVAKPAATAKLIEAGEWQMVREICEVDCVSELLLLARWRQLLDGRAGVDVVEDRLLRQIIELMPARAYVAELQMRRDRRFAEQCAKAANDAAAIAPWLEQGAA
ncbi:hypothetical protein [Stakelama marina]|uniref:Predicted 3'-5' exonuclease PolB-like domain-containing protein n=1 Tax=Stakelama marina TaxID=2826939 RepID=A0A8T4I9L2_9SPHN|nr:hypothetical protein [Stakelama marina]MBR0551061.1 hypothetical protein [Stakelama marina]